MTSFDENQRLWVVEQISEIEKNLLDNPEKAQGIFCTMMGNEIDYVVLHVLVNNHDKVQKE